MRISADAQNGPVSLGRYFDELLPEDEQDERELDGFFTWLDASVAREEAKNGKKEGS